MVERTYTDDSFYLVCVNLELDTLTLSNNIQVYIDVALLYGLAYSWYLDPSSLLEFRPFCELFWTDINHCASTFHIDSAMWTVLKCNNSS